MNVWVSVHVTLIGMNVWVNVLVTMKHSLIPGKKICIVLMCGQTQLQM